MDLYDEPPGDFRQDDWPIRFFRIWGDVVAVAERRSLSATCKWIAGYLGMSLRAPEDTTDIATGLRPP